MKVVVHAGVHRTGTTSLQTFLAGNRETLAARGIAYPGEAINHQKLVWSLKRGDSGYKDVLALLESAEAETAVLSGEDFCILTDLTWLEALAARHEVRAVFYLRRQDHWVMSWYNQHVKWPFERRKSLMGPKEFINTIEDFHWLDYDRMLGRWEKTLGREQLIVRVVERGQIEDVIADFVTTLGTDREGLAAEDRRTNDSLPVHMLEIARHLGLYDMPPRHRTRLIAALREGLADKEPGACTVYSPAERQEVLERFEATNRAVAARYFGREMLFLEEPPAPDDPYFRFPDLPRDRLMREWIAPVIQQLLKAER